MLLHLTCGDQETVVLLQFLSEPEISLCAPEQLKHMGDEPIHIADVVYNVPNLYRYLSCINMNNGQVFQKMNKLGYLVDHMDTNEVKLFAGALDSESINGLADIITVAENLHLYELIPDVTNDRKLGQYLVEHNLLDFECSQEAIPYLDLTAIGIEYYSNHGGAYTENGYVLRRGEMGVQKDKVFCLRLQNKNKQVSLINLSTDDIELQKVRNKLGIDSFCEVTLVDFSSPIPYLKETAPNRLFQCERSQQAGSEHQSYAANK